MRLLYLISFKEAALALKIEERGASRRVLYWDTLSSLAAEADKEPLRLIRKIATRFSQNLEMLSFQHIEVPLAEVSDLLRALSKTGRVVYNRAPLFCDWQNVAKVVWRGDAAGRFSLILEYKDETIPLEACEKVFPSWCLWQGKAFPLESPLSWKWVELFLNGPVILEGTQKKRFLEEAPPILWQTSESFPRLFLTDATGCFANLTALEWEKDLLEVGFIRKTVGRSQYFCPSDKVRDALELLLDVGWEIFLSDGKRLYRQTQIEWGLKEERGEVLVGGRLSFQGRQASLRPAMEGLQKERLWIEIDSKSAGLLDRKKVLVLEGEWSEESLRMHRGRTSQLFSLLEVPEASWEASLHQAVKGLKEGRERQRACPSEAFCGELLPHQQKGLDWLWFLYTQGFSGLLADEMGLGKTVQVLAFFSRLRTNLPVLIVAPTSLLYHWQSEIGRFLPHARTAIHSGAARGTELAEAQYVITSYAMLRIDQELFRKAEWEAIVLDESNAIKTAATQTAKAACALKGRFRICLSGTPMENRPEEIESQFQFLMPGFIKEIQTDLPKIKPFLLRRKKDELDLPEKMEQISWIEMEDKQKALYDFYVQGIKTGLLRKVAADGASAHRMEILEAILRLRQIAADPRLIGAEERGAKIDRLMADLEEALEEKRKVLIYSQFTSMLSLIGNELPYPYLVLDGSVPSKERAERVRMFQEDPEIPLFLLSLKAGGVGLNLTAADYVILIDPWWNEAVENQAIDRAHRIGQKKTVIAKRYIAPLTIEEKMLQLKAEKGKAAKALLDNGEEFNWTEEDLLHLLS